MINDEECATLLVNHKNISCIMYRNTAENLIAKTKDNCGNGKIKIIRDYLPKVARGILMERNSPYVERFNEILIRQNEAGLSRKWEVEDILRVQQMRKAEGNKNSCTRKDLMYQKYQIFMIAIIGYGLSFLFFLGEIIVHRLYL